ncbi:DUF2190 family protein [Nakamurella flava]|uniref:DUF2190 family protein n=1 Tax=Nakamurella flava TaxID=2576308 RepID=A0A4U6QP70_9ACTN|nr:capsid cement protein [Nakamurella flava]TKV61862.1 DUF2190 family protein [Nakamurella flava]
MVDHLPKFKPGQDVTLTAGAAITGKQLLYVSGAGAVSPTTASTANWLGVARQDTAAGDKVVVTKGGFQKLLASGSIAAGDLVVPAAGGAVATLGGGNAAHRVGVAVEAAASGQVLVAMDR